MAKTEKLTVDKAEKKLADAERAYQKLIHKTTGTLPEQQKRNHTDSCRKALAKKRHARAVLEAVKRDAVPPEPADLVESKIMTEDEE